MKQQNIYVHMNQANPLGESEIELSKWQFDVRGVGVWGTDKSNMRIFIPFTSIYLIAKSLAKDSTLK